jgi:uncharacterized protein with von Willebrand factor type A (vWA) domain
MSTKTYRKYRIVKVVQDSGRATYDTQYPDGSPLEWAAESLAVARAIIDATIEQEG